MLKFQVQNRGFVLGLVGLRKDAGVVWVEKFLLLQAVASQGRRKGGQGELEIGQAVMPLKPRGVHLGSAYKQAS